MEKTSRRNTGLDFLRILSMYFVVQLHVQGHGAIVDHLTPFTAQAGVSQAYHLLASCAVNCFGLISGYVMVESGFKLKSLILLWMQVVFYSFGGTVLAAVTGYMDPNRAFWLGSMFPVMNNWYWYFSAYFGMMLLAPALIYAVNTMPQKLFRTMLVACAAVVSVLCTFTELDPFRYQRGYATPAWLIILFLAGGYLRRWGAFAEWKSGKLFLGYLGFSALAWVMSMLSYLPQYIYCPALDQLKYVSTSTSFPQLGSAVMLFLCLERLHFGKRMTKVVGMFAPAAFGVYLIHVHPVIWPMLAERFHHYLTFPAWKLALAVPLTSLAIFLPCLLIDWLRLHLFRALKLSRLADWAARGLCSIGEWIGEKCS